MHSRFPGSRTGPMVASLLVSLSLLAASPVSAQTFGREGTVDDEGPVDASTITDLTDPRFWTGSSYGRTTGSFEPTRDRRLHVVSVPDEVMVWSGNTWPTRVSAAAFRGNHELSPLEKYDTFYADQHARSADGLLQALPKGDVVQSGMDFPGAAKWEGDWRSGYNTARVQNGDQPVLRYKQTFTEVEEVEVRRGSGGATGGGDGDRGSLVLVSPWPGGDRRTLEVTRVQVVADGQGGQWEVFYFEGGRLARNPPRSSSSGNVRWMLNDGQNDYNVSGVEVRESEPAQEQPSGSGGVVLEFAGNEYAIEHVRQNIPLTYKFVEYSGAVGYYYRAQDLPQLSAGDGEKWNLFIDYPKRGGERAWLHVFWETEEVQQDPSGYDGHCNGYAAAAVLFRQPTQEVKVDLQHGKYLRLNVDDATKALPANYRAPEGGVAKPIDYEAPVDVDSNELTFTPRDLKALTSLLSMSVTVSFETGGQRSNSEGQAAFGTRYQDAMGNSERGQEAFADIHAHHMHRILLEYLHERGRGLVVDRAQADAVWNSPVYKYRFQIQNYYPARGERPAYYHVEGRMFWADYAAEDYVGDPQPKSQGWGFYLELDDSGRVAGSRWTDESSRSHPDFLWAPVGFGRPERPRGYTRFSRNVNLDPKFLLENVLVDGQGASLLRDFAYVPSGVRLPGR